MQAVVSAINAGGTLRDSPCVRLPRNLSKRRRHEDTIEVERHHYVQGHNYRYYSSKEYYLYDETNVMWLFNNRRY